jgi:phosphate transport system ATP-binding protein
MGSPESSAKAEESQEPAVDSTEKSDVTPARPVPAPAIHDLVFDLDNVTISYGGRPAIGGVNMAIAKNQVTAFIGPSGCGKTTLLRALNRMNDLIPSASLDGVIRYHGYDLSSNTIDPVEVRRRIGMVFQRPNPFHKSIFDNVAFGIRLHSRGSNVKETVEQALRSAALWDEVKDRLDASALSLSGGQQQRLCIARAIAVEPDVILMDEPASALDPVATQKIEDLIAQIKDRYTIVIVTHNMQQASRIADMTAFFSVSDSAEGERHGLLVEYDQTTSIFTNPGDSRTEAYITGRFG